MGVGPVIVDEYPNTDGVDTPPPAPSPERANWLLSAVSSFGRESLQASQYEELRGLALAQRAALKARRGFGVYIASKIAHAGRWRALREEGFPVVCTWIDEPDPCPDETRLWDRCIEEASNCAALIVYYRPGETLKGCFTEIGAALSQGRHVYVAYDGPIGEDPYAGLTLFNHRHAHRVSGLDAFVRGAKNARSMLSYLSNVFERGGDPASRDPLVRGVVSIAEDWRSVERLAGVLLETRLGGGNLGPGEVHAAPYNLGMPEKDSLEHRGCPCDGGIDHLAYCHRRRTERWQEAVHVARKVLSEMYARAGRP